VSTGRDGVFCFPITAMVTVMKEIDKLCPSLGWQFFYNQNSRRGTFVRAAVRRHTLIQRTGLIGAAGRQTWHAALLVVLYRLIPRTDLNHRSCKEQYE